MRRVNFIRIAMALSVCGLLLFGKGMASDVEGIANDYVSYPFQGIKRTHRTTSTPRPLSINVLEVTIAAVSFFVSPGNDSSDPCQEALTSKTSTFVNHFGLQVGINGDFSDSKCTTPLFEGLPASVAGLGVSYLSPASGLPEMPRNQYSPHEGKPALIFTQSNRAYIGRYLDYPPFPDQVYNAVGGNKMLVENGQPVDPTAWDDLGKALELSPRTSVGLSFDRTKLIIIVIDGRDPGFSEGVTLPEMSDYLIEFGAHTGLNLDGGGSSTMVLNTSGLPEVINNPSDGFERPRPNHLGIYAAPTDSSIPVQTRPHPEENQFALWQNYPNPSNPDTWIPFSLARDANVIIRIHSLGGQLIRTLDLAYMPKGEYISREKAAYWDGSNEASEQVSSGVYFYTIQADDFHATRKLTILR